MVNLEPKNGYLILKPIDEQEETYGNIVIPDLGKERPEMGEVVATSSTFNWYTGINLESSLNVGDIVLIPKLGASRISIKGEEFFIVKEQDIYAQLKD
jgi:chaperonin GroES